MARPCIFCPETATTKEHAIPKWMAGRTGLRGVFLHPTLVMGDAVMRKQPISYRSHRQKMLCGGCQKHFKHLEDQVIPIYDRLERLEKFVLPPEEQLVLARWGLKTAICLLFADQHGHAVPEDDRYQLRQHGTLPDLAWIAYCGWSGPAGLAVNELATGNPDNATPYAYSVLLTTRRVALKCFRPYRQPSEPFKDFSLGQILQAWPIRDKPFSWPPPIPFDDFDLLNAYFP